MLLTLLLACDPDPSAKPSDSPVVGVDDTNASTDSGTTDSGSTDSGSTDSGSTDSGSTDSGTGDSGPCNSAWYLDADIDGFGFGGAVFACEAPAGYVAQAGDCDDSRADVSPDATERCDGVDEDCDGVIDDDALDATTWYTDGDGDGTGAPESAVLACTGGTTVGTDCDDTRDTVYVGATETCNGLDDDCSGTVDDSAVDTRSWWLDADADGFGAGAAVSACDAPANHVAIDGDCDDLAADTWPAADDVCEDGIDQDCDGVDDPCGWVGPIDPDTIAWATWWGDAANADFGEMLSIAGDLDGDGYEDLLVGSPGYASSSRPSRNGKVWAIYGDPATSGAEDAVNLPGLSFGYCLDSLQGAGDVDGDGYADFLVGETCDGAGSQGSAHLFYGSSTRLTSAWTVSGDAVFSGSVSYGYAGDGVASPGDTDGDGYDDLLVASMDDVFLIHGDSTRYAGTLSLSSYTTFDGGSYAMSGGNGNGLAGGDVDGDGLDELVAYEYYGRVASPDIPGESHLLYGDTVRPVGGLLDDWDAAFVGPTGYGYVGMGMTNVVGDLDADGYAEVIAASPYYNSYVGSIWIFSGSATRYAGDVDSVNATVQVTGAVSYDYLGTGVTWVSDLDTDGDHEILVSGLHGDAWLIDGGLAAGLYDTSAATASFTTVTGATDELGSSVAAGDLDGDSLPDLFLGAPEHTGGNGLVYGLLAAGL